MSEVIVVTSGKAVSAKQQQQRTSVPDLPNLEKKLS